MRLRGFRWVTRNLSAFEIVAFLARNDDVNIHIVSRLASDKYGTGPA